MNNIQHISTLNPQKVELFRTFIQQVKDELGYDCIITQSYRSIGRSNQLHFINSKNAIGGFSAHNYGFAIDCNFIKNRITLMKATDTCIWHLSGIPQLAKEMGIRWGGDFNGYADRVHFDCLTDSKQTARWFAYLKNTYPENYEQIEANKINWKF